MSGYEPRDWQEQSEEVIHAGQRAKSDRVWETQPGETCFQSSPQTFIFSDRFHLPNCCQELSPLRLPQSHLSLGLKPQAIWGVSVEMRS
ncbi:hypothetical protein FKM82_002633 [Ascaphus truei]